MFRKEQVPFNHHFLYLQMYRYTILCSANLTDILFRSTVISYSYNRYVDHALLHDIIHSITRGITPGCFHEVFTMIKTVIFDIGKVLIGFDWKRYVDTLFDEQTAERVFNAVHSHGYWTELDLGIRSEADILRSMVDSDPELESEIRTAFENDGPCADERSYTVPLIRDLKAHGIRVLFLSNYSGHLMKTNPHVLDFLSYMDGGVFSCDVHKLKPDPDIYRILIDRYSLDPSECLYVDDLEVNVSAARSLGMQGLVFTDPSCVDTIRSII